MKLGREVKLDCQEHLDKEEIEGNLDLLDKLDLLDLKAPEENQDLGVKQALRAHRALEERQVSQT